MTTDDDTIRIGGLSIRFLLEGDDTAGAMAMFEFGVAAGGRVPGPHSHDAYDETLYGIEGTLTFTVEGEDVDVGPGEVLHIRRGQVHGFHNGSGADVLMLTTLTPGILGPAYFTEMRDVLAAAAGGPPDREAIGAVMRRHGLTPAS
jgi:quercetin dioxygenase-like cupin family protein